MQYRPVASYGAEEAWAQEWSVPTTPGVPVLLSN